MSNDFDAMFNGSTGIPTDVTPVVPVNTPPVQNVVENPIPVSNAPVSVEAVDNTVNTPAPVSTNGTAISKGVDSSFEIAMPQELIDSLNDAGVTTLDIGEKISKIPIEKYRASSSKVDRIAFLTKKAIAVKYHYIEGIGSIVCFGGKCCEIAGTPQIRYIFPICVYSTDSDGNVTGGKVELKILSAGEDLYKNIITINKGAMQLGGIDHVDLLVNCTDDKYQKISLINTGDAIWRQYDKIASWLNERWSKDGANAYMAVARKVDEAVLLKSAGLSEEDTAAAKFDTTQNTDLSKFFDED